MSSESYVIIIGAMKSGTTSLFDILAQHPKIAAAYPKEPGFFAFPEIYAKGFDWYHGLFDFDEETQVYRLDGSTDYAKTPFVTDVWQRMRARPNARYKLIYIMRHPIRRMESHARHVQAARKEIGQVISAQLDHSLDSGLSLVNLAVSHYAQQLAPYKEVWEAGDLLLTTLEELTQNSDRVTKDVLAFLELDAAEMPALSSSHSNAASEKMRTHTLWRRLAQQSWLMTIGRFLLPEALRENIKKTFQTKVSTEGRFQFTPEEETMLWQSLSQDIEALEALYGIGTRTLWDIK